MNRKSFIRKAGTIMIMGIPLVSFWSCNDNSEDDVLPDCLENGSSGNIADNHGHSLTVSRADIEAGTEKTYDITGSSDHPHEVTVTADHFANLLNNNSVVVDSSTDAGHSHRVTVSCA